MSGSAKLIAIGMTYPYQVIRSRIQVGYFLFPTARADADPLSCFLPSLSRSLPLTSPLLASHYSLPTLQFDFTPTFNFYNTQKQYQPTDSPPYTSIPNCITRTYASEGLRGFYKGLATNAVRILPGTCVTFVVYEQVSRWLSRKAGEKERGGGG